jgi:hypothetical protein
VRSAYAGRTQIQRQKPNAENMWHFERNLCGENFGVRRINTNLGFELRNEANLEILTQEIIKSTEIEGEFLDREQVRKGYFPGMLHFSQPVKVECTILLQETGVTIQPDQCKLCLVQWERKNFLRK